MKVSVLILTYNHENYISKAVSGVLMQQADFDFELVIGEDHSTDNTRNIVEGFRHTYPDKIRVISFDTNVGVHLNFVRTLRACRGHYIALLEGDDYWTASDKLQKQAYYLDTHPGCSVCFHNALVIDENLVQAARSYCDANQKEVSTLDDLLQKNFLPTCSVMFRKGLIDVFPEWFYRLYMADWPLHVFNAQHGTIDYLNDTMAVYRIHPAGTLSRLGYADRLKGIIKFYILINAYLCNQFEETIQHELSDRWEKLAVELIERGYQFGLEEVSLAHTLQIFDSWPEEIPYSSQWKIRVLVQIYERLFFAYYGLHELARVRYCLMVLIRYRAPCLKNRGVWSIGIEACLGQHIAGLLRRGAKRMLQD